MEASCVTHERSTRVVGGGATPRLPGGAKQSERNPDNPTPRSHNNKTHERATSAKQHVKQGNFCQTRKTRQLLQTAREINNFCAKRCY
eukprot:2794235-Amphidinium_carterae.1